MRWERARVSTREEVDGDEDDDEIARGGGSGWEDAEAETAVEGGREER